MRASVDVNTLHERFGHQVDDAVCLRWGAWPERLFLVDTEGNVAYAGQQGPWGFFPLRTGASKMSMGGPTEAKPSLEEFLEGYLVEIQ